MTGSVDSLIREAMDIIAPWSVFSKDFEDRDHFFARLVLPARVGLLRIRRDDQGNRVMYTFMRKNEPVYDLPTAEDWQATSGLLWLGDLCYDKGMKASAATLLVGQDMVESGIADRDERIVFYRGYSGRYGYSRVKTGGHADGFREEGNDLGQRPVGEHAKLAGRQPEGAD